MILKILLLLATAALPTAAMDCRLFFQQMAAAISADVRLSWPSTLLKEAPPGASAEGAGKRVRWILDQVYDETSPLGREVDAYFARVVTRENWIEDYFRSYEIFAFSPEYQNVMKKIESALPAQGRILDVGSGPGTLSAFLAHISRTAG